MTLDQILTSDKMLGELSQGLKSHSIPVLLDAMKDDKALSLASLSSIPLIPGVHHDNIVAHNAYYLAGWNDCIQQIKLVSIGVKIPTPSGPEEEFAHDPAVAAYDEEIKRLKIPKPE